METGPYGLVEYITSLIGSAMTAALAAALGRLMYHTQEVRQKRRKFFGWELLWEFPCALMMAFVGEAAASYFGLGQTERVGIIAALSYTGPKIIDVGVTIWLEKRSAK